MDWIRVGLDWIGLGRRRAPHATPPSPHPNPLTLIDPADRRVGILSYNIRVRGVRFAWRSFPNGLYQKKAEIDLGVS